MKTDIYTLPDDVLDHTATFLTHERHFSALACTSRRFNAVVKRVLHPTARLQRACRWGNAAAVATALADERADPTARNHHAIRAAAEFGHADVVRVLMDDGRADPTAIDNRVLAFIPAPTRTCAHAVQLILQHPSFAARIAAATVGYTPPYYDSDSLWKERAQSYVTEYNHPCRRMVSYEAYTQEFYRRRDRHLTAMGTVFLAVLVASLAWGRSLPVCLLMACACACCVGAFANFMGWLTPFSWP